MTIEQYHKYSRQVCLPGFGEQGQEKLLNARVLVVGAGGLGCPVLQYLTGAGLGTIGIIDDDFVSITNLHRQLLYGFNDVGKSKAITAADKLMQLNSDVSFIVLEKRLTNVNAWEIIGDFDVVVDGSDNFETRYLVNDACVLLNKPLVYGSIFRFEGQVAVFNVDGSANYRDVFPKPPLPGEVPDCSEAGVIGVLPGVIGSLMANEAIKFLAGLDTVLTNNLLTYNALQNTFYEITIEPGAAATLIPKNREELESMEYTLTCDNGIKDLEISVDEFNEYLQSPAMFIDVREYGEQPLINSFEHRKVPLSELREKPPVVEEDTIILFCQSGKRSLEAAKLLSANNPGRKVVSLRGGILEWYRV